MSLKRALSTQERVDLAVAAGHTKLVMEHIRIHNAQGEGTGQLTVHLGPHNSTHYIYLPDYAFAAIDCYLTSLGIPLDGEVPESIPALKTSILTMENLRYANHCHEQAAYFQQNQGKTLSGILFERTEFAAIHLAFSMIEEIINTHPFEIHRCKLNYDDVDDVWMLLLPSGRVICRGESEYKVPGCITCVYFQTKSNDPRSTDDILNLELNELADTLHDKGLGLK
jgi:hypothetical protein